MNDSAANHLPSDREQLVSPQTLASIFNTAAEGMLTTGKGQNLGSYVVAYENQASIKRHPVRGRVTHAQLFTASATARLVVNHEIHFPSRDKQAGDFEAGKVIFETHEYDEVGQRIDTERKIVDLIDMAGPELQPFVEQIGDLKQ